MKKGKGKLQEDKKMKIRKDHLNFSIGPVQISEEISQMGAEPVPYFRTPEFSALMKENELLIKKFVNAEENGRAVFITGSGTAAMEASIINLFSKTDKLLVVNGGSFGHRFCEICAVHEIPFDEIHLEYGEVLSEKILSQYGNKGYTGFLVNMHETSTGILYDMKMIGQFCRENELFLVVDAISAFIADALDMQAIGADVILISSQKALAVPPGISIIVLNERACQRINANRSQCFYLDLKNALGNGERGQTPFTPAVGILIQINVRLNQIDSIGVSEQRKKICEIANDFRRRISAYPFRIFSETLSNAITPLSPTNPSVSAHHLFEVLKQEYDIIVCPNGGELTDILFRVGHIGNLSILDNDKLFQAFDELLERRILLK